MKIKTINIYSFEELSEEGKQNAIENYKNNNHEIFWVEEIWESLKGLFSFCNGIQIKDYNLRECNSWLKIEFNREEVEELTGKRAYAWIENNLISNIRIPYTGEKRQKLRQYGKYYYAGMIMPCPFAGVCFDEDFLESLLANIKEGCNLKTAFENLASTYQKLFNNELDYQNGDDYISDFLEANNYEFDIKGNEI